MLGTRFYSPNFELFVDVITGMIGIDLEMGNTSENIELETGCCEESGGGNGGGGGKGGGGG